MYDHSRKSWYLWTGHHWQEDQTIAIYQIVSRELAPLYLRAAANAQEAGKQELSENLEKRAAALRNKKRMDAVIALARSEDALKLTGNEWDSDPLLLGVNNGVIELKTGTFRAGKPDDYILTYAPTDWRGLDEPAPEWEKFLQDIFSGDQELCKFIQRLLGYGISGKSRSYFTHPVGEANGKSTMLEVISHVLGPVWQCLVKLTRLWIFKRGDGPRPFVYALKGKRMVWASESNEGRRIMPDW